MPAMIDDPMAPAIYRASGEPPYPSPQNNQLPQTIVPRQVTLRDRITIASLIPFSSSDQIPSSLMSYLSDQLNAEIEKGDTYPMISPLPLATFGPYWFQNFGAIMILGEVNSVEEVHAMEQHGNDWTSNCLGSFYIKPNYPGRSSHVCNGGFLVTDAARNKGVGRLMGEGYLEWAPKLGYTYSVFNLVYETNVASCRIWDALGFKRIGRVKGCGNLKSHPDGFIDAIIYGRDLGPEGEDFVSEERFDKIRYYLKHGKYPIGADRAEKSRLRSAATHYKLLPPEDGQIEERLMLKDKEVVADPQRQYEISRNVHATTHGGINKTTATIAEKYHWVRIKETVSLVIKNCPECKDMSKTQATHRGDLPGAIMTQKKPNTATLNDSIERLVNFDGLDTPTAIEKPSRPGAGMLRTSSDGGNNSRSDMTPANTSDQFQSSNSVTMGTDGYTDMPLDPQIMNEFATSQPQSYDQHGLSQYIDLGHEGEHEQQHHLATDEHLRHGDQPMAFRQEEPGSTYADSNMEEDAQAAVSDLEQKEAKSQMMDTSF
ncbi:hypothetical protein MMC25_005114 [Agyrium rufum]|nr:hypothetical protein [Agyrium rufum]